MSGNSLLKIGDCLVEQDLDKISRGSAAGTVRPQVMDVLVYLASRGGQIVRADELTGDLWQGKVVTRASVYNCITELRRAFRSCDNQQPYIETVPKRGYKLVAPVDNIRPAEKDVTRNLRLPYLVWASSVIAVIVLATSYLGSRTEIMSNSNCHDGADVTNSTTALANQTVDNKTIAVLPFSDLSEYGDQQHLADGIADELLTALSRGKGVRVAPRRSAFAFRNQDHLDSRAVSDSLDVRYIIEGSVRAADDKILVTAMLTDSKIDQRIVVARNPA